MDAPEAEQESLDLLLFFISLVLSARICVSGFLSARFRNCHMDGK